MITDDDILIPGLNPISISQVEFVYCRASGAGGQYVNRTDSAVQLRFAIDVLPQEVQDRLKALAPSQVTTQNILTIDCQQHRSQLQNREAALQKLCDLLKKATHRPKTRHATKPTYASKMKRLESKKKHSAIKSNRQIKFDD